ncbi:MAG: glycosyltransferase family 4 protein, partial [Nanoarchaeota archaeon]|nr:glycosyltransferase family 4 protein [Nanoarchaeota archaeon]
MKICFLNKNLDIRGGVGRYGLDISESISKRKGVEDVIVLTEQGGNHKLEKLVLLDSRHISGFINLFINALKIRKYIKKYDIIHALDGYPYGVIAALANIGINKKLVINGIGTYSILPLEQPIKKFLMKWAYQRADAVLCISQYTKRQLLKRVKLNNVVVINHGVDYSRYTQSTVSQLPVAGKQILSVCGGLKYRKGLHISIPAMGLVKKKYPDIKYYIVGSQTDDASYFLELKFLVKENNLEKNVIFLENLQDNRLIELYYLSDIFVLTSINIGSDFEGFGLVYLEAG